MKSALGDQQPAHYPAHPESIFMKKLASVVAASLCLIAGASHAAEAKTTFKPFSGVDISGVYECVGTDVHDGEGKSEMTLTLDSKYSSGKFGGYKAKVEADGALVYNGSVVADRDHLAMNFVNVDPSKKDFGVALAKVSSPSKGKFKIEKTYYEPEYMGGGNGVETCTSK